MTPEALAALHPRLFHLTTPGSVPAILKRGLLPTLALLDLYRADPDLRQRVLARRAAEIVLDDPVLGRTVINDNRPLSDRKLETCLLDGLSPADWRKILNERVFFWVSVKGLSALRGARANVGRTRSVLVLRTLPLVTAHAGRVEITPINTGNTQRKPAARGTATFAPLLSTEYRDWRRSRANISPDAIKEVVVRGSIPDIADHVEEVVEGSPDVLADWADRMSSRATH